MAAYIATFTANPNPADAAIPHNSAGTTITIPNIFLNTSYSDFVGVRQYTPAPSRGSATFSLGSLNVTYTPTAGQCGPDTVNFEAYRTGATAQGAGTSNVRQFTVQIANPAAPNISTSAGTMSGTFNVLISSFSPTSTGGTPGSYALTGTLPAGLGFSTTTGVISGTPSQVGTFSVTVTARNCSNGNLTGQTSSRAITITISPAPQVITFNSLSNKLTTDAPFVVSATGGASGLPVTFTASGVCTSGGTNGSTITLTAVAGACTVTAAQAGNTNYAAASSVMQSFNVVDGGAEVFPPNCAIPPCWAKPAAAPYTWVVNSDAGSASQGACALKSEAMPAATVDTNKAQLELLANFDAGNIVFSRRVGSELGWDCFRFQIDGVSQNVGTSSGCFGTDEQGVSGVIPHGTVTIPITAGSRRVTFSYETDNVFQQNGDAAWVDQVTMPLSTSISSPIIATGVFGQPMTYTVTASNFPLVRDATGLPPGLTINQTTGLVSGTPTAAGNFTAMVSASNPAGVNPAASDLKAVTFLIAQASQTITMAPVNNRLTTAPPFTLSATGGASGNPVYFIASGVCGSSGTNGATITLTGVPGSCTIQAYQDESANYDAASPVSTTVSVTTPAAEIFPPACVMPSGWTVPAGATTGWAVSQNEESTTGACSLKAMPMASSGSPLQADIQFTGNFSAGNITFRYRVDTENTWDCFQFFIDGAQQNVGGACASRAGFVGASGQGAWTSVSVPVTAGTHTIKWRYDKDDFCCNSVRDAVWIDEVVFPLSLMSIAKSGTGTGVVTSEPAGINCGTTCNAFMSGSVRITAAPAFLSYFVGWAGGGCSGTAPCNLNLDSAKSVTATFTLGTFPGKPQNVVATPGNGQATISFTAPASDGGLGINGYSVTCTAAGQTTVFNNGAASPITLTGMVHGVAYTCAGRQ